MLRGFSARGRDALLCHIQWFWPNLDIVEPEPWNSQMYTLKFVSAELADRIDEPTLVLCHLAHIDGVKGIVDCYYGGFNCSWVVSSDLVLIVEVHLEIQVLLVC